MIDIFLRFTGLVCIEPVSDETGGTRIVFPIRNDPEGYSGRKGHIHPHYLRLYIATLPPIALARGEIALELNAINAQGPPTNQFGALVIRTLSTWQRASTMPLSKNYAGPIRRIAY